MYNLTKELVKIQPQCYYFNIVNGTYLFFILFFGTSTLLTNCLQKMITIIAIFLLEYSKTSLYYHHFHKLQLLFSIFNIYVWVVEIGYMFNINIHSCYCDQSTICLFFLCWLSSIFLPTTLILFINYFLFVLCYRPWCMFFPHVLF